MWLISVVSEKNLMLCILHCFLYLMKAFLPDFARNGNKVMRGHGEEVWFNIHFYTRKVHWQKSRSFDDESGQYKRYTGWDQECSLAGRTLLVRYLYSLLYFSLDQWSMKQSTTEPSWIDYHGVVIRNDFMIIQDGY
ncbi:uncharacterized protein LOC106661046 [Cimex lectularius]|uniref:Uncharacterized protein n=1 Tax=Cimex lectularius TaxID=79782 RepID=A0A8I6R9D5_CIMLE|nr:uncharacterized protein LOC106661046 [Cimex lectularius]